MKSIDSVHQKQWAVRSQAGLGSQPKPLKPTGDQNHRCYKNLKVSPHRYEQPAGGAHTQIITHQLQPADGVYTHTKFIKRKNQNVSYMHKISLL